ncbi:hypothetical protein LY78DRAFT_403086 [Colletotrichum sublineola]|nr:hypothetical protein LY78DRAFT_403086 [Colletotrichum sublineola]
MSNALKPSQSKMREGGGGVWGLEDERGTGVVFLTRMPWLCYYWCHLDSTIAAVSLHACCTLRDAYAAPLEREARAFTQDAKDLGSSLAYMVCVARNRIMDAQIECAGCSECARWGEIETISCGTEPSSSSRKLNPTRGTVPRAAAWVLRATHSCRGARVVCRRVDDDD